MSNGFRLLTLAVAGMALAGCGGSGGGGSGSGSTGTASFSVTDAPADDVDNVFVTFDRIDIQPEDGERLTFELDEPRQIDLLTLQGTNAEPLIEDIELDVGTYSFIRLFVDGGCASSGSCSSEAGSTDSYVVESGGGQVELFVPGNQPQAQNPNPRFVQLASPFTITAGGSADFTIDVELRKALTRPQGPGDGFYLLRPALRLVDNSEVGSIAGTVDEALVMDASCTNDLTADTGNAVYLYQDFDASPGDVFLDDMGQEQPRTDGNDHPVVVTNVTQDEGASTFSYSIGFVEAGDYTLAFTCQAADDEPASEDSSLEFASQQNVTVEVDQQSQADFTTSEPVAE